MTGSNGTGFRGNDPVWWVLEHSRAKGSARLLLVGLAKCADYRKCIVCVSVERLAKLTGLSRSRIFRLLKVLQGQREIHKLGFDRTSGVAVYHLGKFCEMGSDRGVLWAPLSCPHVQAFRALSGGVAQTPYIREEENAMAKTPLGTEKGRPNGHGKLRGTDLYEHNLRVIAETK